jgi:hypothetical protein
MVFGKVIKLAFSVLMKAKMVALPVLTGSIIAMMDLSIMEINLQIDSHQELSLFLKFSDIKSPSFWEKIYA